MATSEAPSAPHAAPAPHHGAPVNPFAAPAPPPAPAQPTHGAPVNPFAQQPAPPPPPASAHAPVNPFAAPVAHSPPVAHPPPVNPFASPGLGHGDGPYRHPPTDPRYAAEPAPSSAQPIRVARITTLRPLSTLVAIAVGIHVVAVLFAIVAALGLEQVDTLAAFIKMMEGVKDAESFYIISLFALLLTVVPWLFVAARNARRLCADKPRFPSWLVAASFLVPLVNLLTIGVALDDISRHSHERAQPSASIVKLFARLVLLALLARAAVAAYYMKSMDPDELRGAMGIADGVIYAMGLGDPARFVYVAGLDARPIIILVALATLAIPFLALKIMFSIERTQLEAHRRLRAKAL